jgi:hypothetical protein
MSASEFAYWMALYELEYRERETAQKDAEAKVRAQRMAQGLRRF